MKNDVIKKAKRNLVIGTINKFVFIICPFIEKTMIMYLLGSEYLGLNSFFLSVVYVLNLSELGFGTAITCCLYKPLADENVELVNSFLNYSRSIYRKIGLFILIIGLLIIPILPRLLGEPSFNYFNTIAIYIVYLLNTVISYFLFAYLSSIITAHQREDIISFINTIVRLTLTCCQIGLLFATRKYFYFIVLLPFFTILSNVWIAWCTKKNFSIYHCEGSLSEDQEQGIKRLVAGTFIQKACAVSRNSIDSICVTSFLGLTMSAVYNNYYDLSYAITKLLGTFSAAFLGGIGIHVATKSVDANFQELRKLDFVYMMVSGWCTVCLLCLYQPFMELWMGKDMLLPMPAVFLFCVYFYLLKLGDIRYMYMSTNGLFWEHRWRAIVETIANLVLNIVLGKIWGVYGIIIATIVSLFLCNFIWANKITFELYFNSDYLITYYKYQGKYAVVTLLACTFSYILCSVIFINNLIGTLIIRAIICTIISALFYFSSYSNLPEMEYIIKEVLFQRKRQT